MSLDLEKVKKLYNKYISLLPIYKKMYCYYKGKTDAITNYKMNTKRSNLKVNTNFIKKFIKEEVSYSIGNKITYSSKSDKPGAIECLLRFNDRLRENYDCDLMKYMLLFSKCYELYYIDDNKNMSSKIIKPINGIDYIDNFDNLKMFLYIYKLDFDSTIYIDVYTKKYIYHLNSKFEEVKKPEINIFKRVPIGIAAISEEGVNDTLYNDIKGIQDALETNLSDSANEISDFRNAYLFLSGMQIDKDDADLLKEKGIFQSAKSDGTAQWLVKNINDNFTQNTIDNLEEKIYQITDHINYNEKLASNVSSLTLRSRLISLEERCKLQQRAFSDCIKERIKFIFMLEEKTNNNKYDYTDINIKYTPNVPQDDLMSANVIEKLRGIISEETALSLLSFVDDPKREKEKRNKETIKNNNGTSNEVRI